MTDSKAPAHNRVVEDYFRTTSAVGRARGAAAIESSMAGLRRRLGSWLDATDMDVLDLGSGTGELCRVVREAGARRVVGVNLCQEEIDFARQRNDDAVFVREDIASYLNHCEANSFDRIYALNILEHLDKDTLVVVLEGAVRALRPGAH